MSSIRTVHNADHESFKLWMTFWFLLYLFTPILNLLRIGKLSQILFILWLSLPRFQGALWIYQQVFEPVMEKYSVERKVDERIQMFWIYLKGVILKIIKDLNGVILAQVGLLMSCSRRSSNVHLEKEPFKDNPEQQEQQQYDKEKKTKATSRESKLPRKPSHSIFDSFSSTSSYSTTTTIPTTTIPSSSSSSEDSSYGTSDIDLYRTDFLNILKQGLHVFAYDSREIPKRFRLRVFYYENLRENILKDQQKQEEYFVLETVDDATDSIWIALDSICSIEQCGLNGIRITSYSSLNQVDTDITDIVLSDEQDQQILLQGLKVCLNDG